jgi:hypothetical protein
VKCATAQTCNNGKCSSDGVFAFGEWRPAMRCADFVDYSANSSHKYRKYCFTLKSQILCTGQHGQGNVACTETARGIRFVYDYAQTWPMRFTKNTDNCENYHPDWIQNFAYAIGYSKYTITLTKTGNYCPRTYIDNNGLFQITSADGAQAQIYDIEYHN